MPSTTSTSTTSPSSFSTTYCATLAPTLPAPTTVIFGRGCVTLSTSAWPPCCAAIGSAPRLQLGHVLDDGRAELRALDFLGPLHQPCQVIGHHLLLDGGLEAGDDAIGRLQPPRVAAQSH